jgi:hypothetical protein
MEDNIKTDVGEICWRGVEWMHMVQDRDQWRILVHMVKAFLVP